MSKSKYSPANYEALRATYKQSYAPKSPKHLRQALDVLEAETGAFDLETAKFAEEVIQEAASTCLKFREQDNMMPSMSEWRLIMKRHRKQVEGLRDSLRSTNGWVIVNLGLELRRYDETLSYLDEWVERIRSQERNYLALSHKRGDLRHKGWLVARCREILEAFSGGKRFGFSKEGPLARFTQAVFLYATGNSESFERQLKSILAFDQGKSSF